MPEPKTKTWENEGVAKAQRARHAAVKKLIGNHNDEYEKLYEDERRAQGMLL